MQRLTPAASPLIPASQAPVKPDAGWNQYRARVIAAITDVENLLRQHNRGVDDEGMTYEVAPLLGHSIDTLTDFAALHRIVKALRYVARDTIQAVRTQQGGQFALPLF